MDQKLGELYLAALKADDAFSKACGGTGRWRRLVTVEEIAAYEAKVAADAQLHARFAELESQS